MTNTGIKRAGLRSRVAVISAARRQVVVGIVVSLAVGGAVTAGRIHLGVHVVGGLTVVVITGADLLLHHIVVALHPPY